MTSCPRESRGLVDLVAVMASLGWEWELCRGIESNMVEMTVEVSRGGARVLTVTIQEPRGVKDAVKPFPWSMASFFDESNNPIPWLPGKSTDCGTE